MNKIKVLVFEPSKDEGYVKDYFDKLANYTSKSDYLNTFFQEKAIDYQTYSYEIDNFFFSIDSQSVIEEICRIKDIESLKNIENQIRYIDFHNGNLHHFFRFLGELIAKQKFEQLKAIR